ncbi:LOW QUALITY PROTEIN: multidrug and toxin extrusion protein 2 [Monodelphis domestica]|uniref:LOW QUALITY PROTEIN: multidrug and toxin extrusion protein 2 n=1 Tax=Monodelphis domestica TaxID=13616 RepID=UPI0024E1F94C|nr:LOW QUALITY PROTEIN: multidrug and toxin extrusion protein 2 [Monodelphis domestica]
MEQVPGITAEGPSGDDKRNQEAPSRKGLWRIIPEGFLAELYSLFFLAGPMFIYQLLIFMIFVVSTIFCGHLGKLELAAVTLAVAFVNICGVSVGYGMASACDTLMSQTYGSTNKKYVGVILQRGILILLLCCFPCWALFINTEQILLLLRQDPDVSSITQEYVMLFLPALPMIFLYCLEVKYLHNQGIVWPQVLSSILANGINVLANYIFVSILDLGVPGSALANTISQFIQPIVLFLYIMARKLYRETWEGWSLQCLQDWQAFLSLAIPGMLMICIEWWAYEIGSFLIGLLSVAELSAQSIIYEVSTIAYMIPLGFGNAACVRVGNALGAGNIQAAKKTAVSSVLATCGIFFVIGSLLTIFKDILGRIFTNDEEVNSLVIWVMPVYIAFNLFESLCCVCGAVLRGTGKVVFGAAVNAVGYYAIGLPIGAVLVFVAKIGVRGLWLGMLVCAVTATITFIVYTARINWNLAAEEAQKRVGLHQESESTSPAPGLEKVAISSVATDSNPGITLMRYSKTESHTDLLPPLEAASTLSGPRNVLSLKQLAVRRGLSLLLAVTVLVLGVTVKIMIPVH